MKIHIGKRIIKTALTLFLILMIYILLLLLDKLIGIDKSNWKAPSNMYTPFFAGIAAIYATHRDKKTSIKQAKIRSIGSIIGGYIGMIVVYIFEFAFDFLAIDYEILYYLIKYSFITLCIIPLIVITVKLKQVDAVFITCVTFLSVTISVRNGGMPVFQFATNRVLSTLIGVLMAVLVNNYLFSLKKTSKNVLFVSSLENNFLKTDDELSPFVKYKLNDLFDNNIPLLFVTTRSPLSFEYIFKDVNINYPMIAMNGACKYRLDSKKYSDITHIDDNSRKIIDNTLNRLNVNAFIFTINDHILHAYHSNLINDGEKLFYNRRKNQNTYSLVKGIMPNDLYPSLYIIIDTLENVENIVKELNIDNNSQIDYVIYKYKENINSKDYYYLKLYNKSVNKENYVKQMQQDKGYNKLIVSASGKTDLKLIEQASLSMCLSSASNQVKEKVDIVLPDNPEITLKIFDSIYHCKNIDKKIEEIKLKYKKAL